MRMAGLCQFYWRTCLHLYLQFYYVSIAVVLPYVVLKGVYTWRSVWRPVCTSYRSSLPFTQSDWFAYRFANQASKHCLRIWSRPLACLRRRICSLQMEEVNMLILAIGMTTGLKTVNLTVYTWRSVCKPVVIPIVMCKRPITLRGPHHFWCAPVTQQPLPTKFGIKVVTATYCSSDCKNSLYYHTSRDQPYKLLYKLMSSALFRKIWCIYLHPVRSYWHYFYFT